MSCYNLLLKETGKWAAVFTDKECSVGLKKPIYSSLFYYDQEGFIRWVDGSSERPLCLPNLRYGEGYLTYELLATTPSGCVYRIPVAPTEVEMCPENPGDPAPIITVLVVPNAPS